jgi:hypothetical protein
MAEPDKLDKMICKPGVAVPTNPNDAQDKINDNMCAGYYLQSSEGESNML